MPRFARILLLLTCLAGGVSAQEVAARAPRLVVFLTVDQLRPDYFKIFDSQLTGGLGRLARGGGGAVFLNGYQDHANTETAPGHASTLSGRFPRSTGIVANAAGVEDSSAPLIGDLGTGASPYRFRGTTLIDWLVAKTPASRALSVSRKDRGAILPLGKAKEHVYWYSGASFTTSTYYRDSLETWVNAFNARRLPQRYAGTTWDLLLPAAAYPEPDSVATESAGRNFVFPHPFPTDSAPAAAALPETPMMDDVTLAFALAGLQALSLGASDSATDILAVSLSSTDAVGHRYGPDSRELHDQIVRLDRALGAFLDSLFVLRDSSRIVIALTADHGVTPVPGSKSRYPNGGAGFVDLAPTLRAFFTPLRMRGLNNAAIDFSIDMLFIDRAVVTQHGLNPDSLGRAFAEVVRKVPGVQRADLVSELARRDTTRDYVARRWLHMLPPDLPAVVTVTLKPYWLWAGIPIATHGSPHDADARVPIIFWGSGVKPGTYTRAVRVVDMAPTLAAILKVSPLERLDGQALREVMR
ncbi:MAG: alkaline phosphatase family protein [Gemmatimonadaceae bacterium]